MADLTFADGEIGRFTYDLAADRWHWDDVVFRIHGMAPGEIEPTMAHFLQRKHERDRDRVGQVIEAALRTGEPFTISYRLMANGDVRHVIVVGEALTESGAVTGLQGYYLDVTQEFSAEARAVADAAVAASAAGRDTIEQAKGVLMLSYGLDADAAFAMLRWWSRNHNLKVRTLAERLVESASGGSATHPHLRSLLDGLIADLTQPLEAQGSGSDPVAGDDDVDAQHDQQEHHEAAHRNGA